MGCLEVSDVDVGEGGSGGNGWSGKVEVNGKERRKDDEAFIVVVVGVGVVDSGPPMWRCSAPRS